MLRGLPAQRSASARAALPDASASADGAPASAASPAIIVLGALLILRRI